MLGKRVVRVRVGLDSGLGFGSLTRSWTPIPSRNQVLGKRVVVDYEEEGAVSGKMETRRYPGTILALSDENG